jgi:hypothetical protein
MKKNPKSYFKTSPIKFKQINKDERSNQILTNIQKMKEIMYFDKSVDISLPNEIFNDLQSCPLFKNWQQVAFAYSYYYLISYLFRNCIYGKITDISSLNLENIRKQLMGIAGQTMTGIYKQNGILDQLGYTYSLTDYPIDVILFESKLIGFEMFRETDANDNSYSCIPSKFMIKVPLKGLYYIPPVNYKDLLKKKKSNKKIRELLEYHDGHFFNFDNTHVLTIEAFIACMCNPKLGYKGFYLYGFYRRQSDQYQGGFNASIKQIQDIIPISERTLYQYHQELETMKLITKTKTINKPNNYKATRNTPIIEI